MYTDLPPLLSLLKPLSGNKPDLEPDDTSGIFEIHEKADYVDMAFYVEILSVAISNVDGYVAEERKNIYPRGTYVKPGSPSKQAEKAEAPLQLVRTAVENLHSQIGMFWFISRNCLVTEIYPAADTRAAHLDRSRTKAALKQVSMRMYYQRLAALKLGHGAARNIKQYFTPKT
jgi:hypothetical protein